MRDATNLPANLSAGHDSILRPLEDGDRNRGGDGAEFSLLYSAEFSGGRARDPSVVPGPRKMAAEVGAPEPDHARGGTGADSAGPSTADTGSGGTDPMGLDNAARHRESADGPDAPTAAVGAPRAPVGSHPELEPAAPGRWGEGSTGLRGGRAGAGPGRVVSSGAGVEPANPRAPDAGPVAPGGGHVEPDRHPDRTWGQNSTGAVDHSTQIGEPSAKTRWPGPPTSEADWTASDPPPAAPLDRPARPVSDRDRTDGFDAPTAVTKAPRTPDASRPVPEPVAPGSYGDGSTSSSGERVEAAPGPGVSSGAGAEPANPRASETSIGLIAAASGAGHSEPDRHPHRYRNQTGTGALDHSTQTSEESEKTRWLGPHTFNADRTTGDPPPAAPSDRQSRPASDRERKDGPDAPTAAVSPVGSQPGPEPVAYGLQGEGSTGPSGRRAGPGPGRVASSGAGAEPANPRAPDTGSVVATLGGGRAEPDLHPDHAWGQNNTGAVDRSTQIGEPSAKTRWPGPPTSEAGRTASAPRPAAPPDRPARPVSDQEENIRRSVAVPGGEGRSDAIPKTAALAPATGTPGPALSGASRAGLSVLGLSRFGEGALLEPDSRALMAGFSAPPAPGAASSTAAPVAAPSLAQGPTAASLAPQLAVALSSAPNGTVEITLSPEELGRVRLSLSTTDAALNLTILAERPETAELMRRHADGLLREFRAMGYEAVTLAFGDTGGQSTGGQSDQQEPRPVASDRTSAPGSATAPPEFDPATPPPKRVIAAAGLDIRL